MYRTLVILTSTLDFLVASLERVVSAVDKLQDAAVGKATALDIKAETVRREANERALDAAYDNVERAERILLQQIKAHKAEIEAIQAAHG